MGTRKPQVRKLTVYKESAALLAEFEEDYGSIIVDCSTPKGMKSAKDCRKEIRDARLNLEDLRKETKAPALAKCTQIDDEAKAIKEKLDVLFTKFDSGIKAIENAKEIAAQAEAAEAVAKLKDLEAREQAIFDKEVELGLREPLAETDESDGDTDTDSGDSRATGRGRVADSADVDDQPNTICEPHIKAAAERLHALKKICNLVEPSDPQPEGEIDEDIALKHNEILEAIWEVVDEFQ